MPQRTFTPAAESTPSPPAPATSRAMRWVLGVGAATMVAIIVVLVLSLSLATGNRALYERNYGWLLGINAVVAVLLVGVLVGVLLRLALRLRRGRFGSRLLVKLAAIFGFVAVVPGLLIYGVSYQFVNRSIESWFDVKVEGALQAGLDLGRVSIEALAADMVHKTRTAATSLGSIQNASAGLALERLRDALEAQDLVLWSASGESLASVGASRFDLRPERPGLSLLRSVRQQSSVVQIEGLDDSIDLAAPAAARVKVWVPVVPSGVGLLAETRYLQATFPLPSAVVVNAMAVQDAHREYQERALARGGLRRMYIGTLTLSLFLAVFGAVLLAILLGNQLARPLLVLAEGVREVAKGNLGPKVVLQGSDELGGLTRSFAQMTQQLADAQDAAQRSMVALEDAHANLQTMLDNLTSGVIVLDAQGIVRSSNPGATRILRAPMAAYEGQALAQVPGLAAFAQAVQHQFDAFLGEQTHHGLDHWQHSLELHPPAEEGAPSLVVTLIARGAELPHAQRLLVLDDISEIVSAQRTQAWGEVARRLAHEIKNPLTPIQLSAERLEMKLDGKLPPPEQAILSKSVKTIVDQVDALKRLVNEFRDYARLPAAELKPLDLNALVTDVLQLYGNENAGVLVQAELDPHLPSIAGDAQQLRQVVHNLLQNAQDATAQAFAAQTGPIPPVCIATKWSSASGRVRLTVQDQGSGFPAHILQRAFEPYVTTKPRGTGLGLAVVKKIADEHGARIDLSNRLEGDEIRGAQVSLSFAAEPREAVL